MDYNIEEIRGMENQLQLLIKKMNRIRESLALETDPSRQVQFEQQIIESEAQIQELRQKVAQKYNINTTEGQTILQQKISQLNIEEDLSELHLVNCNREKMKDSFWNAYDEKQDNPFQFYFIGACPTQMPPDFAERMVYEIIIEELDEELDAIHCERKENNRVKIVDLPVGRNLERSQHKFREFFSEHFDFNEQVVFENFLETGIPKLKYEFISMVFEIHERKWKPFFTEYFQWIMNSFTAVHDEVPKFIFFFVIYINHLHENVKETRSKKQIVADIDSFKANNPGATALFPLMPVPTDDLQEWLINLGERNPAKINEIIEILAKGLKDPAAIKNFKEKNLLNMSVISRLQEIVFNENNKKKS